MSSWEGLHNLWSRKTRRLLKATINNFGGFQREMHNVPAPIGINDRVGRESTAIWSKVGHPKGRARCGGV